MTDYGDIKDKGADGAAEPLTLLEKALVCGREALGARDIAGLHEASRIDPSWVATSWKQGQALATTLALPAAVRLGWDDGVKALAELGGAPLGSEGQRGDWGMSDPPPLAEALARGHWGVVKVLEQLGARPEQNQKMIVWAAAYRAHKAGASEGTLVINWAREHGFNPWSSEAVASACSTEFLLAGSVRDEDDSTLEIFERALFEGYVDGPQASQALWCHVFAVAGGADKCAWLCELYLSSSEGADDAEGRATHLLSLALKGGCPKAARAAAEALPKDARSWESFGGKALESAAGDPVSLGDKEPESVRVMGALKALWDESGERLATRPRDMERVCFLALKTGRTALFAGLMEWGATEPEAVMTRWVREASTDESSGRDARAPARLECLAVLMAKALGSGVEGLARAEKLHEQFIGGMRGHFGRRVDPEGAPEFSESLAAAQRVLLSAQGSRPAPKRVGPGRL